MLTVTALTNAEYLLGSVALGIDEYYMGVGEAPGVWMGQWSSSLGVAGVVEADALRALIDGNDPKTGAPLLVGLRERKVKAFDLTFSAPKAASLLWALGSEPVADVVMVAHREAVASALGFLEERAALARIQVDGLRRHVPTEGWAVAAFVHRTSRAGDPQLHTHCLVPNVVRRDDGRCVAIAARPMFVWARAAGSIYQAELQRLLSLRLGVEWQADRNNTREIAGFTPQSLRTFSKRTVEIEAELEATGTSYEAPALRMRADNQASLATRPAKDHTATPALLFGRWQAEATEIGLEIGTGLERQVCWRDPDLRTVEFDEIASRLVDDEHGLCAHSARFAEHDVIAHVAALAAGRLSTVEITDIADRFLGSDLVVRLTPTTTKSGWEPARWSTVAQRDIEDDTLRMLDRLTARAGTPIPAPTVAEQLAATRFLGVDQCQAVSTLCGPGGSVRTVLAPAGYGKTAIAHVAAGCATTDGRAVIAVATTAKAVAELETAGLSARTIARFRYDLCNGPLPTGTVVILDEISQTSTGDAHSILAAVDACAGGQLWVLGDPPPGAVSQSRRDRRGDRSTRRRCNRSCSLADCQPATSRPRRPPRPRHLALRRRVRFATASPRARMGTHRGHTRRHPAGDGRRRNHRHTQLRARDHDRSRRVPRPSRGPHRPHPPPTHHRRHHHRDLDHRSRMDNRSPLPTRRSDAAPHPPR